MNASQLVLRCYVEKEDDGAWFSICLDLNLYARADSQAEARSKLDKVILEYVIEAFTVDRPYIDSLMPRRAPASFWIRYWFAKTWLKITHISNAIKTFKTALPVVPQSPVHC